MKLLKNLLSGTYYFFILLSIFTIIMIPTIWIIKPEKLKEFVYSEFDHILYFIPAITIEMSTFVLFIIVLYKMRKIVTSFCDKEYFTIKIAKDIKLIGNLMIIMFIVDEIISTFLTPLLRLNDKKYVEFQIYDFLELATFKLFIGLFLLGIGKAFELGLKQHKENQLTI